MNIAPRKRRMQHTALPPYRRFIYYNIYILYIYPINCIYIVNSFNRPAPGAGIILCYTKTPKRLFWLVLYIYTVCLRVI